jgi:glycosyltransferase involved in cell wall biosynthesis
MKIIYFTQDFAPLVGGVQTIVMELAQGLVEWCDPVTDSSRNRFEVTVATRTPAGDMDDSSFPFRVVRQPTVTQLFQLFRKADIIHLAGASIIPMALGLSLRKPIVIEHHGYQTICPSGNYLHEPDRTTCPGHFREGNYAECFRCGSTGASRIRSAWNIAMLFPRRWLAKRVAANVAVSDHNGRRIALPRTQTIYHGIRQTGLQPAPLPGTCEPLAFAYVGRLVPEKGVDLLLRAAAEAKESGCEFRLKVIGDGPERSRLELLADQLHLDGCVEFLGYCEGSSLQNALANISVTVMPSLVEEACPMAVIEQMMRGVPVIAAEIGGLDEVVGGTGLKFRAGDAGALARCIRKALNNRPLIASLGQAARKRALDLFVRDQMVRNHAMLYEKLVSGNGQRDV